MTATHIAHWPGQDAPVCDLHLDALRCVGSIMGITVSATPCTPRACSNCEAEAKAKPLRVGPTADGLQRLWNEVGDDRIMRSGFFEWLAEDMNRGGDGLYAPAETDPYVFDREQGVVSVRREDQ